MTDAIRIPERSGDALLLGGSPVQPQADLNWAEQFFTQLGRELGQLEQDFMQQWSTAQQAGLPGGQFTPELEAMFSRIANLNTLGGDVLQQLRPNLALSEATVSRWMSAPVEAPALTVTGAADHNSGWLFSC